MYQYVAAWFKKVECTNHAIKSLEIGWRKLFKIFKKYKGKGKLAQQAIKQLIVGAKCAIKMHKDTKDVALLHADLRKGPCHIFNDYSNEVAVHASQFS